MNSPSPPDHPAADHEARISGLALFPLSTVLFPDGLLALRIFEARYLDLISQCLRSAQPFGIVTLVTGDEVIQADKPVRFESSGCLAHLDHCDSDQAGLLQVRCRGLQRFELCSPAVQQKDGLWRADVQLLAPDRVQAPSVDVAASVAGLRRTIEALDAQGDSPFLSPYRFDDAGWVANRWSELVPLPTATKLKLMTLQDPGARLALVHGFLLRQQIIKP